MVIIQCLIIIGLISISNAWASEDWSDKPIIDDQFREVEMELEKEAQGVPSERKKFTAGDRLRFKNPGKI
jgi:hypothetical protein